MRKISRALFVLTVLSAIATGAGAADIAGLYSTGVDNSGNLLPGGSVDPHYSFSGNNLTPGQAVVLRDDYLWYSWPRPSTGKWINYFDSPNTYTTYGPVSFSTTFDLTGFDPRTARINLSWTGDNDTTVWLNGFQVAGIDINGFSSLHDLSLTDHFRSGLNTLEFRVSYMDSWDGVLVSGISGTAERVPVPSSLIALASLGMVGVAVAARRHWRTRNAA